jgi:ribosomal-protein-alanine N-acetyltransferase
VSVCRAGPAHVFVLAAIQAAAFPEGEAWSAAMVAAQLGQPGVFALLDEAGGMIVIRVAADEAEILTLGVAPEARRGGVGAALVREACAEAASRGAGKLFLEVSARNAAARALYEGVGFEAVGRRRRYYADGADAVIMARVLVGGSTGADELP